MKTVSVVVLCAISSALCGCVRGDANIYGGLNGQRIVGNETYVTITNVWNEMDALPLAEGVNCLIALTKAMPSLPCRALVPPGAPSRWAG
jgi:hypothetical protein